MIAALAVIRWFHEICLMLLFGGAALCVLLRLSLPWGGLRQSAAAVALSGGLLWFCLAAAAKGGLDEHVLWLSLTQSLSGQIFVGRAVLLVFLCVALWCKGRESLVALLSGAALVLIAFTSHAADASPAHFRAIGAITDAAHLLMGGFWIGGLSVLALLFARGDRNLPRAAALFAQWGMVAVAVLILTGMLNAASILLGSRDTPLYLSVLGAKLVLVAVMLGLAVFHHMRLLPGLAERGMAERLDRNIRMEFALGLVVVGLAVVLSLTAPTLGN